MTKQLPNLAISMVALTACGNRVGLMDKITDGDVVKFCEDQAKCEAELLKDLYVFYCVNAIQDARHQAKSFGCETEFNDLLTCEIADAETEQCRSEYSDYDDWADDRDQDQGYYGYYGSSSSDDDECDDEQEDYQDCINDFLGIDDSNNTQPYYGYSTPYYG